MKEIKGRVKILLYPVPKDSDDFQIIHGGTRIAYFWPDYKRFDLPKGVFKIIGKLSELTENQAKDLVDTIHIEIPPTPSNDMQGDWKMGYVDYEDQGEFAGWGGDVNYYRKATDSFISLLKLNECFIKEWIDEPNPLNFDIYGLFDAADRFNEALKEYEKIPEDFLILKVNEDDVHKKEIG